MRSTRRRTARTVALVVVVALGLTACASESGRSNAPATPAGGGAGDGDGRTLDAELLDRPPPATGEVITAEQAEGVGGTVVDAWLRGDRARAENFVTSPDVLDELFGRRPPSSRALKDDGGYCSRNEGSGSYTGCSYSVADGSKDGILALAVELGIERRLVLVRSAGFADWND